MSSSDFVDVLAFGECSEGAGTERLGKTGIAGWGVYWGANHGDNECGPVWGNPTINRAYYIAAIKAMETALNRGIPKLRIHTDCELLVDSMEQFIYQWKINGWRTLKREPVKNVDLILKLDDLRSKFTEVEFSLSANNEPSAIEAIQLAGKGKYRIDEFTTVYTHGACGRNATTVGILDEAGWSMYWPDNHKLDACGPVWGPQTGHRGDIIAAIKAIEMAEYHGISELRIRSSSEYLVSSMDLWIGDWKINDWKKADGDSVKNEQLLKELDELRNKLTVVFELVSHGDPDLETCYGLATLIAS